MSDGMLFDLPEAHEVAEALPTKMGEARIVRPHREQLQWLPHDLEAAVSQDHPARAIWGLLEQLDLTPFYHQIQALRNRPGRPTTDPRVLLAVWLLATVEGVGSARRVARLCEEHDAYRWLRGGVPINYHMLADFRVTHGDALDQLLTQIIAALLAADAVTLERVAQDGMRVRASAGASSYRRKERLAGCLREAQAQVQRLAAEREHPDTGGNARASRARERAAEERVARVAQALACLPEIEKAKERQRRTLAAPKRAAVGAARVSTTDPEARVMKMPDGGFRPAYNVELATDSAHGVIVGVAVTAAGTDAGQAAPMEQQIAARTGRHPKEYLMDGGFAARDDITELTQRGVTVYAPVRLPRNHPAETRYAPRSGDSAEVAAWRARMAGDAAKAVYRQRSALAEWTNAQVRYHGVTQFTVRSLAKVRTVMLLVAVAHNLLRWRSLTSL